MKHPSSFNTYSPNDKNLNHILGRAFKNCWDVCIHKTNNYTMTIDES